MDNPPAIDIRTSRQSLKMTQTELANALGVNLSTIWRWEKNIVSPPRVALQAVSKLVADASSPVHS